MKIDMNHKQIFVSALAVFAVAIFLSLAATTNMLIEWDASRYLLVAEQIEKGNGIKTPIIWFQGGPPSQDGLAPFTEQPPGYPLVLAAVNTPFLDLVFAARVVNVISHALIALLVLLIVRNFASIWISALTALSVAISVPSLLASQSIWAEHLFTVAILASVYFMLQSRNHPELQRYWILAAVFAALAITVRYAGVFLVVVIAWEAFHRWKLSQFKLSKMIQAGIGVFIPVFTVFGLLLRNYVVSGNIRGFAQPTPERSIIEASIGVHEMFYTQFGIGNTTVMYGMSLLGLGILLSMTFWFFSSVSMRPQIVLGWKNGLETIAFTAIAYVVFVIYALFRAQPLFEDRFMYPLVPIVFSLIGAGVGWLNTSAKNVVEDKIRQPISLFVMTALCIGMAMQTVRQQHVFSVRPQWMSESVEMSADILKWLDRHTEVRLVTTNTPFVVAYYGGVSVLRLPQKFHNPWFDIPGNMQEVLTDRMEETGARYLLIVGKDLDADYFGEFISSLSKSDSDYSSFELIEKFPTGKIFKLKSEKTC